MINETVYKDYRNNIIEQADHPILAYKANRDRYTASQPIYAGYPQIGSIYSEDAITWNVFLGLKKETLIKIFSDLLESKIKEIKILLWTLSIDQNSYELQWIVGSSIRAIDGKHGGQVTEPDIIIETDSFFIVIEAKLGRINEYPTHLWEASEKSEGPEKRYGTYFVDNENPFYNLTVDSPDYRELYQLFRMAFFSYHIGKKIGKKPILVSLLNESWLNKTTRNSDSPSNLLIKFKKNYVSEDKIDLKKITWQEIAEKIKQLQKENDVYKYLLKHKSLY